jgi:O-antigen/teichoic acid export membrane protein
MSLLKNSTIVIAGVVVSNLLAYVFHFISGRMLGPEDYGALGALMALFLLTALPASALGFALSKFTSRFYSKNEFEKIAQLRSRIVVAVLIFSIIILLVVILFSRSIADFLKISSNIPVIVVGIMLAFAFLLPVNRGVLQGMKKFQALSLNTIIEALSRLILLVLFLYLGYSVIGALLAYGLAYFIAFLIIFLHIKETNLQTSFVERIDLRPVYKFIFQVLIVNVFIQSIINVPSLFIKHFFSSEFTGYWTAALNIARMSLFITGSVSLVMFPEIAAGKEHSIRKKIFKKAIILVLGASFFMALLFFFITEFFILSLYGSAYLGAVPILKIMGFVMVLIGLLQLWFDYRLAKLK